MTEELLRQRKKALVGALKGNDLKDPLSVETCSDFKHIPIVLFTWANSELHRVAIAVVADEQFRYRGVSDFISWGDPLNSPQEAIDWVKSRLIEGEIAAILMRRRWDALNQACKENYRPLGRLIGFEISDKVPKAFLRWSEFGKFIRVTVTGDDKGYVCSLDSDKERDLTNTDLDKVMEWLKELLI